MRKKTNPLSNKGRNCKKSLSTQPAPANPPHNCHVSVATLQLLGPWLLAWPHQDYTSFARPSAVAPTDRTHVARPPSWGALGHRSGHTNPREVEVGFEGQMFRLKPLAVQGKCATTVVGLIVFCYNLTFWVNHGDRITLLKPKIQCNFTRIITVGSGKVGIVP